VYDTIIHRNTRLGEAPSFGKPAIMYDAESKGSINYMNLVREILQRNNATNIPDEQKALNLTDND
jgi:chromosome partitioning protein